MRKIVYAGLMVALAVPAMAQKTVVIKGTVSGDTKGYNKVYIYGTGVKQDSTEIHDGRFEFSLPFEESILPLMYLQYDLKLKGMYSPFGVLVETPGTVTISDIDITKGLGSGKVAGIKSAVDYSTLNGLQSEAFKAASVEIEKKWGKPWLDRKDPRYEEFQKDAAEFRGAALKKVYADFTRKNPDSYAAAFALAGSARSQLKVEDLEEVFKLLSPKRQKSPEGEKVISYINGVRNSAIGKTVADFTLNTPEEKPLAFSSLKGKYVLIDFWASWCGPCKASFPHMKEIYSKFKSDKFEIYSISIDADKEAWLKELKVQELPWLQTLDTKNISQSGFAVTAVPTTFLISPDGKILEKEIGFKTDGTGKIEKMLVDLFGKGETDASIKDTKNSADDKAAPKTVPMMRMQ